MKKTLLMSAFIALILNGCGGGSSTSSYKGTLKKADSSVYTCTSESAFNACKTGDCSSCEQTTPPAQAAASTSASNTCTVNGSTISAAEGQTCTNNGDTLSCSGGRVTLNGSITAKTINMNGTKYTCQ